MLDIIKTILFLNSQYSSANSNTTKITYFVANQSFVFLFFQLKGLLKTQNNECLNFKQHSS